MLELRGVALVVVLYVVPVFIAWAIIYTAVLAALRRHDRDPSARL